MSEPREWIRKLQRRADQKKCFLGRGLVLGSGTALSASHSLRTVQVDRQLDKPGLELRDVGRLLNLSEPQASSSVKWANNMAAIRIQ